jgi:malonyl-CoA/methylmalonyl-CoA synthetase
LDYIIEATVLGVQDEEFGQRTAAIVVVDRVSQFIPRHETSADECHRKSSSPHSPCINYVTTYVCVYPPYKLPTLLLVVDELPKTASGKVPKNLLRNQLFPKEGHKDLQIWRSKGAAESRL